MPPAARQTSAPPAEKPGAAAGPGESGHARAAAGQLDSGHPRAAGDCPDPPCCPYYHEAVELIGKRWTGAILQVLVLHGGMRFSEIAQAVPELSDRLLSERMKELEARGVVARDVQPGPPVRVQYTLSSMGRDLEPALVEIQAWAQRWLAPRSRRHP